MCTVSFVVRRTGYALGMNRDEKRSRIAGLPPRRTHRNGRTILAPSEPNGGTWIGVNDSGATLALINWYSVAARVAEKVVSRGEVVRRLLPDDSAATVDLALADLPLNRVNPFRLIGVFPTGKSLVEWRWNLQQLERREHSWRTNTWISSGFDEPGAQRARGRVFKAALQQTSVGTASWLHRLHRSHGPVAGPYSTCMHREDAATVSYTEIRVSNRQASMSYTPGAPCCTHPSTTVLMDLRLTATSLASSAEEQASR